MPRSCCALPPASDQGIGRVTAAVLIGQLPELSRDRRGSKAIRRARLKNTVAITVEVGGLDRGGVWMRPFKLIGLPARVTLDGNRMQGW